MTLMFNESLQESESDDYLIELMGLKGDFPEEALAAYGKIYGRYWEIMYRIALGVTRDAEVAQDLLSDTFNLIYIKASTFKKGKIRNPANMRLSIQKWMTTIMQHIFYDHFLDDAYKKIDDDRPLEESYIIEKKYIGKFLNQDYDDFVELLESKEQNDIPELEPSAEDGEESTNVTKIKAYVSKLSERDQDIVLTVYSYYVPGKYTPTEILDNLVKKWGTTRDNIRKILEKFRKSIKEELQANIHIRKQPMS